jgi:hypothetical protein
VATALQRCAKLCWHEQCTSCYQGWPTRRHGHILRPGSLMPSSIAPYWDCPHQWDRGPSCAVRTAPPVGSACITLCLRSLDALPSVASRMCIGSAATAAAVAAAAAAAAAEAPYIRLGAPLVCMAVTSCSSQDAWLCRRTAAETPHMRRGAPLVCMAVPP